ncbi:MAG TPA: hypothetical protein ENO24_03795, partial [Chloroflexi bacterium]|nr:hypothetical protein [Chloroflexota bacterium]
MKKASKSDIVIVLTLVLVAAFFRLYRLHEWPPGLWRDEAANGLEALRVLEGDVAIFYGTREPMFIYLAAGSIALLGRNPLATRMAAAVVGTVTVPVAYVLVREVLRTSHPRARLVAVLTSLWLATSYWHVCFSRLGFRGVLLPLFAALTFYLLWRGWNGLGQRALGGHTYACVALSGVCLGLSFYTYTPSRFLPLLLILFLARVFSEGLRSQPGKRTSISRLAGSIGPFAVFALLFVLTLAPLCAHFLAEPGSLLVRSGVTIFGADQGEPLTVMIAQNVVRQLGMFGFFADPNTRHNPAGRPVFDLVTLAFFLVGFLLSLRRWRQIPYLFCLVWFLALQ